MQAPEIGVDLEAITRLCHGALQTVLLAIAPIIVIATVVGFVIAFLEAITAIQDQGVVTTVRLLTVVLLLFVLGGDMGQLVFNFASAQFQALGNIGVRAP